MSTRSPNYEQIYTHRAIAYVTDELHFANVSKGYFYMIIDYIGLLFGYKIN